MDIRVCTISSLGLLLKNSARPLIGRKQLLVQEQTRVRWLALNCLYLRKPLVSVTVNHLWGSMTALIESYRVSFPMWRIKPFLLLMSDYIPQSCGECLCVAGSVC